MIALLRLCRLYYAVPMALTYGLTVSYASGGNVTGNVGTIALSVAALALVIAAGYVLNDAFDVVADRVNAPGRPIPVGRIRQGQARAWAAILFAAGWTIGAFGARPFSLGLVLVSGGLIFYDVCSKRLGVFKPVTVALLMVSIYPLAIAQAGGVFGPRAGSLIFFSIWMFLSTFAYQVLKDIRDIRGDRPVVGRSTPIQSHPEQWRRMAAGCTVAGAIFLIFPFWFGGHGTYLALVVPAIMTAVISAALPVLPAIRMLYIEFVIVGIAATMDIIVSGF